MRCKETLVIDKLLEIRQALLNHEPYDEQVVDAVIKCYLSVGAQVR